MAFLSIVEFVGFAMVEPIASEGVSGAFQPTVGWFVAKIAGAVIAMLAIPVVAAIRGPCRVKARIAWCIVLLQFVWIILALPTGSLNLWYIRPVTASKRKRVLGGASQESIQRVV